MKTAYHVFTHEWDDWFDTYEDAKKCFDEMSAERGSARLYKELRDDEGELIEENCIESFGGWPY